MKNQQSVQEYEKKVSSISISYILIGIAIFFTLITTFIVVTYLFFNNNDEKNKKSLDISLGDKEYENGKVDDNVYNHKKNDFNSAACKKSIDEYMELTDSEELVKNEIQNVQQKYNDILNEDKIMISIEDVCIMTLFITEKENKREFVELEDFDDMTKFVETNHFKTMTAEKLAAMINLYLEPSRQVQRDAAVKSAVSSTVPSTILCMDYNGYITEPVENIEICKNNIDLGKWPIISDSGGKWGGCETQVNRENGIIIGFEYCAKLPNDIIMHCTEKGCIFD